MEPISLKFWQSAGNLSAYKDFISKWFEWAQGVIETPIKQYDAESVSFFILNLMAYEKGIERFDGESDELYRKRVKYADANMQDAGTQAGLQRIWERLELGYLEISERIDDRDWDIVELRVTDDQISEHANLLDIVVKNYGLTCRRYEITTMTIALFNLRLQICDCDTENIVASTVIDYGSTDDAAESSSESSSANPLDDSVDEDAL